MMETAPMETVPIVEAKTAAPEPPALKFVENNSRRMLLYLAKDGDRLVVPSDQFKYHGQRNMTPEKPVEGAPVFPVARNVYEAFEAYLAEWMRPDGHFWYGLRCFMVGADQRGVIRALEELNEDRSQESCDSFLEVSRGEFARAAFEIARKGYRVAGLARVGSYNSLGPKKLYWTRGGITFKRGQFMFYNFTPAGLEVFSGRLNPEAWRITRNAPAKPQANQTKES